MERDPKTGNLTGTRQELGDWMRRMTTPQDDAMAQRVSDGMAEIFRRASYPQPAPLRPNPGAGINPDVLHDGNPLTSGGNGSKGK